MFAYVKDGVVRETCRNESPFNVFFPEYAALFVPCPDTVEQGDMYDGESWTKPAPVVVIPQVVTMRQARLALLGAGLLDDVETAINAMSEPAKTAARIEWDYSSELQRAHPLVSQLGGALGLTGEQLDSLFITASGL